MKVAFRKFTSWLLVISLCLGLGLSAAPALADEAEPEPPVEGEPIEAEPLENEGDLVDIDLTDVVEEESEDGGFFAMNIVVPGGTTSTQLAMEIVGPLINNQESRVRNVSHSGGTPASSGRFHGGADIINIEKGPYSPAVRRLT